MSLVLESIKKSFGEKKILDGFSYVFSDVGLYNICGESGSGKTTLLRIICGLDNNFDGYINGGGIESTSFCFQEYRLFEQLSAVENIALAAFDSPSEKDFYEAEKILLRLNFSKADTTLFPRELSGGMKQRVAFARAVLYDAPILILDEPTKEVDEDIAKIMREIILEESKKRLVLLVSHKNEDMELEGAFKIQL